MKECAGQMSGTLFHYASGERTIFGLINEYSFDFAISVC